MEGEGQLRSNSLKTTVKIGFVEKDGGVSANVSASKFEGMGANDNTVESREIVGSTGSL